MNLMVKMGRGLAHVWTSTGRVVAFIGICLFAAVSFAAESITITARPRYPWNGKVDLKFTIDGTSGTKYDTSFTAKDLVGNTNLTLKTLYKPDGSSANAAKEQLLPGTYNWVWNATADLGEGTVLEKVVVEGKVTAVVTGGVQLWKDGPYWADCNVGAKKPEEAGYYFWWGDTKGYERVGDKWNAVDGSKIGFLFTEENCLTYRKDNKELQSAGYIDSTGNLIDKHDAATVHLGAPWRMPTYAEMQALISHCTIKWTSLNGMYGRLVTGKDAYSSKSIFLPASGRARGSQYDYYNGIGYYYSSTPSPKKNDSGGVCVYAWDYYFYSSDSGLIESDRMLGYPVRPLRDATK